MKKIFQVSTPYPRRSPPQKLPMCQATVVGRGRRVLHSTTKPWRPHFKAQSSFPPRSYLNKWVSRAFHEMEPDTCRGITTTWVQLQLLQSSRPATSHKLGPATSSQFPLSLTHSGSFLCPSHTHICQEPLYGNPYTCNKPKPADTIGNPAAHLPACPPRIPAVPTPPADLTLCLMIPETEIWRILARV